ncbi:MAG TPA: SPOR domain-containing protein [Allosphingosinicella sp.]|nr:SPOR domain-containing protein [Allosphingosinicella sp.]
MRGARCGLWLLAGGFILTGSALAQNRADLPPGAVVQSLDDGPGTELRRNLTTLADNPRSVSALIGAGRAALAMGDAEAAFNFFERADQVEPRNARARGGMASAMVQLERPRDALPLFAQAAAFGAPEAELAGDRGLAHDMLGDPGRAQADYTLALRRRDDPEIRRRMALSLAISGQRAPALRMIDAQLRDHERAAWRTQAFILALTGDPAGADRTARNMMPAAAGAMAPFFARLASLSPSQKAMAVHFGHFPSDGRARAGTGIDTSADPGAMAFAEGRGPAEPPRARIRPAEPVTERRRPDAEEDRVASLIRRPAPREVAPPVTRPFAPPPEPRPEPPPQIEPEVEPEPLAPEPEPEAARDESVPVEPAPVGPAPVETAAADGATAGFTLVAQGEQPAAPPPAAAPASQQAPPASRLRDLADIVASLPEEEQQQRPTPPAARTTRGAEPRPAPQRTAERSRPAQPAHPSRHWVQIAGGANRTALPATFVRLRAQAPALLGSRTAFTTPLNQTNRLLVGPFDSARAAQAFVNELAGKDVAAFAWTSPPGQEIERLRAQTANDTRSTRSRSEPEQRPAARGRRTN